MLQAELHNKDSTQSLMKDMEDVLTSNVFGVLKNIDPYFLKHILQKRIGVDLTDEELIMEFWPSYKNLSGRLASEPDCIIRSQHVLIVIEAKYNSTFGQDSFSLDGEYDQLKREYRLLEEMFRHYPSRYLVTVTADYICPEKSIVQQFRGEEFRDTIPDNLKWLSWYQIYTDLEEAVKQYRTCQYSKQWIHELLRLLRKKNLKGFTGFHTLEFEEVELLPRFIG
jgi:hypothetical protein